MTRAPAESSNFDKMLREVERTSEQYGEAVRELRQACERYAERMTGDIGRMEANYAIDLGSTLNTAHSQAKEYMERSGSTLSLACMLKYEGAGQLTTVSCFKQTAVEAFERGLKGDDES